MQRYSDNDFYVDTNGALFRKYASLGMDVALGYLILLGNWHDAK